MVLYKSIIVLSSAALGVVLTSTSNLPVDELPKANPDTYLSEILLELGDKKALHHIDKIDTALARKGMELVYTGYMKDENGKCNKKQSKYFVCTDCHNTQREDPDLKVADPQARLNYIQKNGGKFLPATTFYGIVNRESWYNDDYAKKYGDLVVPTHDTLANAIQLCATECSQGRKLTPYELNAVLHYFHSIQFRLKDLELSPEEYAVINTKLAEPKNQSKYGANLIMLLKQKYLLKSPATFIETPSPEERKYGANGNPENGKAIYEFSCLNCHARGRVTNFTLDHDKTTFKHLKKRLGRSNHFSVYYMVRTGNYAVPGRRPYMPNFTKERMSEQQLEDLVAYINQQAN